MMDNFTKELTFAVLSFMSGIYLGIVMPLFVADVLLHGYDTSRRKSMIDPIFQLRTSL